MNAEKEFYGTMRRYVALLRGINVSGKNKISMAELKDGFENMGFQQALTYLNSGNVVFSCEREDTAALSTEIEQMIKTRFDLEIPVYVTDIACINDALSNAPDFWGNDRKEFYDNLIFVMPPATAEELSLRIGEPTEGLEQIRIYKNVIFWSFDRNQYAKANWWKKTARDGTRESITIRTANTVRKIAELGNKPTA